MIIIVLAVVSVIDTIGTALGLTVVDMFMDSVSATELAIFVVSFLLALPNVNDIKIEDKDIEVSRESPKYQRLYQELRSSFIMQYEPQLLGEYTALPKLKSQNEDDIKVFLEQMRLRQEKASEVPEELFSLDYYYFEKQDTDLDMELQLESRFEYIGGSTSGKRISKFHKIYKDVYKYYGVSEDDIKNHTERYENLLRQLAIRH